MAQSLINVIKIFLPIIISGNVLGSVCPATDLGTCQLGAHVYYIDSIYPVADVVRLHNAIANTNKSIIIDVFITKHLGNRKRFLEDYSHAYGKILVFHCRTHLFGKFGDLITALANPKILFLIHQLHVIFSNPHRNNYDILFGILWYHDIKAYRIEMVEHFKNLPDFIQNQFDSIIDPSSHNSGDGELKLSQPDFFCEKLLEASRDVDMDRFTFFIVSTLNDDILNEVDFSCTLNYDKPLKSLLEALPYEGYREAVSAILNASRIYEDNMLRSD
ncbi:annexin B9-like isoform X2 [Microplitis mediator]|uniref:annexin B9-like isoform X2 n=1 Tax=Microplitis mediator TaxID=375433 RepID=UPI0025545BDE|nr:annexin B9-like isoform X2 [Microplitis mediator]